ncbi:MAG: isoprenoid biosynthesis glyoxalase ElbB [Alphaproteobacteria bacterium]|nr:isoprenoid biosynthesis glyoxalase ElbB [Alphaproteobacteria bacterium]
MKIAIILSGCGVFDGSEIHEATCTMLNIDKQGAEYQCFAPNETQSKVVNHFTHKIEENSERNILVEAARIARGNIKDIRDFNIIDFDAVIFPGGSGAVTNLCDFFEKGRACEVNPEVVRVINDCYESQMPIGAICIAPALIAHVLGQHKIVVTIGNDKQVASVIEENGAIHKECKADEIAVDEKHKIVTTPAYMLAKSIKEVDNGIAKLVAEIIRLGR